ncbi:MAG: hypothetical protein JWQ49_5827 [Edaphobacter sp.]|nr:hypothetical protein [Edaphobacter sp.]
MSKSRLKILFWAAISLLSTGSLIWMRWESPIVVLVVPVFLFLLVCFVVILRHKPARQTESGSVVSQTKAGHVS